MTPTKMIYLPLISIAQSMVQHLQEFFSGSFMAHGYCFLWKPQLVWLHVGSDFLIALAYFSIPLLLIYFVWQRQDLPFQGIFLLFSAFIVSCGTDHLLEIWTLWHPDYWLSGLMKATTAIISLYTASELVPLIPKALALPSPAQLEAANLALEKEIFEHKQTVQALQKSQHLAALVEIQHRLLALKGEENCYTSILEILGQSVGASHVMVFENAYDVNGNLLLNQCAQWVAPESNCRCCHLKDHGLTYEKYLLGWNQQLMRGETIMRFLKDFPLPERLLLEKQGILSLLVLPLTVKNQFFGCLILENCAESKVWSASAVDLLRAAAAALSLQHERSKAEVALRQSEAQFREQATQLEQTLYQLKQTQTQLVQSEKMSSLGMMIAGIAHEINNPICFVYANIPPAIEYIQDLLELINLYQLHYPVPMSEIQQCINTIDLDFIKEDLPNLLGSMKLGAERIRDLVTSLRTFSRLDESKMKQVNIHEGLESTLLILQHKLKETPGRPVIELIKNYEKLPLVECYPRQLNQVFTNILVNAIDALDSQRVSCKEEEEDYPQLIAIDSPKIEICTQILDSKNVVIKIRDNGPGMSQRVQLMLFDPFFTTKPVGKGTGLGMSISYQIVVNEHGGDLRCVSSPGQGTEFIIQIPIVQGNCHSANNKKLLPVTRFC